MWFDVTTAKGRLASNLTFLAIVVAVGLAILLLAEKFGRPPIQSPEVQAHVERADSLVRTQKPDSIVIAKHDSQEVTYVTKANTQIRSAIVAGTESARLRELADVQATRARRFAQRSDSLQVAVQAWMAAYDTRTLEAASERARADSAQQAFLNERAARLEADQAKRVAQTRLTAMTQLAKDLRGDIDKVNSCRVLWLVPCPSRTGSAVVGFATGVAAGVALSH